MDELLKQLRSAPSSPVFDGFDDGVLLAVAKRKREVTDAQRFSAFAAVVSLGLGTLMGAAMGEPDVAVRPLSPFAPATVLAPSTLLDPR